MADVFSRLDRIQAGSVKRKDTAQGEKAAVSAAPSSSGGRDVFARLDRIQPVTDRHTAVTPSRKTETKKEPGTQKASQASGVSAAGKSGGFRARSGGSRGDGAKAQGTKRESYLPAVGGPSRQQVAQSVDRAEELRKAGYSTGTMLRGMAEQGGDQFVGGVLHTVKDYVEKPLFTVAGAVLGNPELGENAPVKQFSEWFDRRAEERREKYAENAAKGGTAYEKVNEYGSATVAAIPQALVALGTAGGSTAAQGLNAVAAASTRAPGILTTLKNVGEGLARNPNFWTSFLQVAGDGYEEAKADGASDAKAGLFGMVNGLANAAVEVGGGIQTLPAELQQGGKNAIRLWVESMVDEGKEEVVQGILERGLQKLVYDRKNPLFSTEDESAVVNPRTALKEFSGGAVVGGILGGGQMIASAALNAAAGKNTGEMELDSPDLLRQAAEEAERNGRVSNRTAERILADEEASGSLGVFLDPTMTKSQRRSAVKDAVSARAETREGAAGNGQKTTPGGLDGVLGQGRRMELDRLTAEQQEAVFQANEEGTVGMDAQGRVFTIDPAQHITRRSYESVGKRNVNAFQFDHPELHPYYREAAEALIADADLSLQQPMGQRYERTMQGNRTIQNAQASAHLRQAMDETGLSRDAIIDAAQRIVHDQGQENTAAAKRVELILDGMLSHGWRSMDGESVGPNQAYLTARDAISGAETDQAREPLPIWDMEEPADRGRSAEELRQDIGLVRRAAAALGQNGSRALTAAYDEATARSYAPQDVAESFFQVYNAALNGEALGAEAAQKAAALPEHVRLAAESAGRKDAQRTAEVKAFGENAGLTRDAAWRQAHLSSRTSAALDAMGKALGVEVRFAETVADGRANAQYGDGVITLALDAQDPVLTSMTHEAVHRIRDASPEAYGTLAEFVQRAMTEESLDFNLGTRAELYRTTDVDALTEEMVADAFGRMMESDTLVERLAQEHRSLAQRIADVFRDIVAALDAEDVWFSKPHYAYAMAQYCKARGITAEQIRQGKGVKEARAYAVREAQKATYRDTNAFSQAFSELGRSIRPGNNKVRKGVSLAMEGILPFRKTPANILARGVEYSPIGLMVGIKQAAFDVKSGKKTGAEAIDSISAGLTGTGLVAMGLYLASQGLVRGHGGDDDKERKMEEMMGHQAYALELPDGKSVTLDWLAPECLPFFVGVNLWEQTAGEAEDMTLSTLLNSVKMVSEPMLEMSCLQSLNDVFDAVGYASSGGLDGLPAALASAATSYLTQALPTLLGQAERTAEDRRYTTYTERNAFLTSDMQYTLGRASARIPGVDYQQIPYIDAWGRPEMSGNAGERAFNNFLNPAYTSEIETSAMEEELLRLYRSTGEGGVLPSRAAKYFTVSGERKDLTAEEYVQYATLKGQASYQLIRSLTESEAYRAMSEEEKVQAVKNAYDLATQTAKAEISDFGTESWVRKAVEAQEKYSIPRETYITLKTQVSGLESLKDREGETIDNSRSLLIMEAVYNTPGLSDKQRQAMFEYLGVGKKVRNLNKAAVREKLREMRKG